MSLLEGQWPERKKGLGKCASFATFLSTFDKWKPSIAERKNKPHDLWPWQGNGFMTGGNENYPEVGWRGVQRLFILFTMASLPSIKQRPQKAPRRSKQERPKARPKGRKGSSRLTYQKLTRRLVFKWVFSKENGAEDFGF